MPCHQNITREDNPQNSRSVAELQQALRRLSFADARIPLLSIDDIYGPETAQAVRAFQEIYQLPVTGVADLASWNAIFQRAEMVAFTVQEHRAINPFSSPGDQLRPGDLGDAVYILQAMLHTLGQGFGNLHPPVISGMYDATTERAVRELQQAGGLPATGRTDKATWNLLADSYNSHKRR